MGEGLRAGGQAVGGQPRVLAGLEGKEGAKQMEICTTPTRTFRPDQEATLQSRDALGSSRG